MLLLGSGVSSTKVVVSRQAITREVELKLLARCEETPGAGDHPPAISEVWSDTSSATFPLLLRDAHCTRSAVDRSTEKEQ